MLIALRTLLLALWLALCVLPHLIARKLLGSIAVSRLFLRGAAWIMGLRVRRVGPAPDQRTLLLANHVSWLDIVVMASATGCAFVSKAEVKDHWMTGWLADQRETLYIDRQARRSVDAQIAAIAERFDHHLPLAVFPEGTTSNGLELLKFRPALLAAATPLPDGAFVRPVAIDYRADRAFVGWVAPETGMESAKKILSRWKPIHVDVHVLAPLDPREDRKDMAADAYDAIHRALFASSARDKSL
ncbi:lysophospholipid acyltransferase family protein [Sphingomicrobium flavum]|uniref:lysophospholipid acyltransferase family protein n=1 Tax=Sphingomicrobium flavum TaxID=1229164 RepID=UPI0021AD98CE|nr:lysophospholipid acyltransferase family protein [Sphingomicrobium flavum]